MKQRNSSTDAVQKAILLSTLVVRVDAERRCRLQK
jgi:hypothetical protein